MSTIGSISQFTISQGIASLPKYDTNELRDLPTNHAAQGVLANGDVFFSAGALLTASDKTLLQSITGESSVQVQDDPLAIAIGRDRGFAGAGWTNKISEGVTTSYLENIKASEANPATNSGNGSYDGVQISTAELNTAISYLTSSGEDSGSTSSLSVSA